jgi:hypothetical protein
MALDESLAASAPGIGEALGVAVGLSIRGKKASRGTGYR